MYQGTPVRLHGKTVLCFPEGEHEGFRFVTLLHMSLAWFLCRSASDFVDALPCQDHPKIHPRSMLDNFFMFLGQVSPVSARFFARADGKLLGGAATMTPQRVPLSPLLCKITPGYVFSRSARLQNSLQYHLSYGHSGGSVFQSRSPPRSL